MEVVDCIVYILCNNINSWLILVKTKSEFKIRFKICIVIMLKPTALSLSFLYGMLHSERVKNKDVLIVAMDGKGSIHRICLPKLI
jgi:hypothetical protein